MLNKNKLKILISDQILKIESNIFKNLNLKILINKTDCKKCKKMFRHLEISKNVKIKQYII